jgi:hypothetical protein
MNDTEKILAAIGEVDTKLTAVTARMDDIEKRVEACEKSTERTIHYQGKEIEALRRKVEELAHSDAAVWKSRDELEIGIDRETAYEAFRELGIRRRVRHRHDSPYRPHIRGRYRHARNGHRWFGCGPRPHPLRAAG